MSPFFRGILVWLSRSTPICVLFEPMGICDVVGSGWMHWSCTDWWRRKIASCFSFHPWQSAVGRKVLHETTKSSCGDQGVRKKARIWNLACVYITVSYFQLFWCVVTVVDDDPQFKESMILIIETVIHCTFADPWYLLQKIAQCQQMQQAKSSNVGCSRYICGLGF